MTQATLHYIYDPLCGWCYAAAPLVQAAREVPTLNVVAHGGGMMTGNNRRYVTPKLRSYILPHDQRITEMTGQVFGENYRNGLLCDTSAMLDSEPPIAAMLAAEQLAGRGLDMLAQLQIAHYVEGRRIADEAVLVAIAGELGLDADAFAAQLKQVDTPAHIKASRALLQSVDGDGFPTFALEQYGQIMPLDSASFLGQAEKWKQALTIQTQA